MTVTAYSVIICGHNTNVQRCHARIEKVKFGVPIQEAFSHDIPPTLLVLLLKVNKEGPYKKDIWRAPGNIAHVRKLAHIMQHGHLVNLSHFSVYTAASVVKKFLSKLPNGIFGEQNEDRLFKIVELEDAEKQRDAFCRVVSSLCVPVQHLLVLLFGTFRLITDHADACGSPMSPEAIGVSVAPSLFHTCIHNGQRAKIEDVVRFRIASEVVTIMIHSFGHSNLFPRENYEFYARITGRTLRIDENWLFTFQYPAKCFSRDNDYEDQTKRAPAAPVCISVPVTCRPSTATPVCLAGTMPLDQGPGTSRPYDRHVAVSVGEMQALLDTHRMAPSCSQSALPAHMPTPRSHFSNHAPTPAFTHSASAMDRAVHEERVAASGVMAESTRSLCYLQWVHEQQQQRMHSRSEWFLTPSTAERAANLAAVKQMEQSCDGSVSWSDSQSTPVHTQTQGHGHGQGHKAQANTHVQTQSAPTPTQHAVVRKRSWRTHYSRPRLNNKQRPSLPSTLLTDASEVDLSVESAVSEQSSVSVTSNATKTIGTKPSTHVYSMHF